MLKTKEKSRDKTFRTPLLSEAVVTSQLVKQSKCRAMEGLLRDCDFNYNALSNTEKEELFDGCFQFCGQKQSQREHNHYNRGCNLDEEKAIPYIDVRVTEKDAP